MPTPASSVSELGIGNCIPFIATALAEAEVEAPETEAAVADDQHQLPVAWPQTSLRRLMDRRRRDGGCVELRA
jgi:hypothetical protein